MNDNYLSILLSGVEMNESLFSLTTGIPYGSHLEMSIRFFWYGVMFGILILAIKILVQSLMSLREKR